MSIKKTSTPGTKPNYLYSILGVTLVLVLLGFFGFLLIQANEWVKFMKENVEIISELKENISESEKAQYVQLLNNQSFIKKGSVKFVSKDEGAKILQDEFGDDFLKLDMPNPLFDIVTFNINATDLNHNTIEQLIEPLKKESVIRDIFYQKSMAGLVTEKLKKLGYFAFGIGVFLLFVTIYLIHNTIRLAMYSNRFLIKNMELVGATWEFISMPYIKRSILHGLLSGFLAILILTGLWFLVEADFPELSSLTNFRYVFLLMGLILILGILISGSSTFYVVNKYLRMRVDDLY